MANNTLSIKIQAVDEASAALNAARANIDRLAAGMTAASHRIRDGVDSISTQLQATKAQFAAFYLVIPKAAELGRAMFAAAESYRTINARLQNATQGARDFNQAQGATVAIARATGASLDSVAGLYGKLRLNAGMAADDAEKLTGILARATQLDGGGQGAQAALFQLQQGLASGTLRGEELNSVLEQTPTLALQIAKGLGVPQGELRKLAEDGKLTAEAVKQALFRQTDAIDALFGRLPVTAARAFENIKTSAITEFGQLDAALGVTSGVGKTLQLLADNFRAVVGVAVAAAGAITAAWLQSIATRSAAEAAAHAATLAQIVQRKEAEVAAARATLAAAGTAAAATAAQSALTASAAGLVAARMAATEAAAPVSVLTRLVGLLGAAFRFLTGPIGLAITAVSALTGYLVANRDEVVKVGGEHITLAEGLRAAWGLLADTVGRALRWISDKTGITGQDIRNALGGAFAAVTVSAKTVANGVVGAFVYIGGSLGNIAGSIAERFRIIFRGITDMAGGLWEDVKNALSGDTSFKHTGEAFAKAIGDGIRDSAHLRAAQAELLNKAFDTDHAGNALTAMGRAIAARVRQDRDRVAAKQAEDWFNEDPAAAPAGGAPASESKEARAARIKRMKEDEDWAKEERDHTNKTHSALIAQRQEYLAAAADLDQAIADRLYDDSAAGYLDAYQRRFDTVAKRLESDIARFEAVKHTLTQQGADGLLTGINASARAGYDHAVYDAAQEQLTQADATRRQRLATLQAQVTAGIKTQSQAWAENIDISAEALEQMEAHVENLQALADRGYLPAIQAAGQYQSTLIELRDAAQDRDFLGGINRGLTDLGGQFTDTFGSARSAVTQAFAGMTDALADFVMTGKLSVGNLADAIVRDIVRIQIQQNISKPIAGALGRLDFSALKFWADGGVPGGESISAWRNQIVARPTLFAFASGAGLMGEAGPEAIMPLTRGPDGRLGVQAQGAAANVQVIINNNASGTQATARERSDGNGGRIIEVLVEQLQGAIAGNITRGAGPIPAAMSSTYGLNRVAGAY